MDFHSLDNGRNIQRTIYQDRFPGGYCSQSYRQLPNVRPLAPSTGYDRYNTRNNCNTVSTVSTRNTWTEEVQVEKSEEQEDEELEEIENMSYGPTRWRTHQPVAPGRRQGNVAAYPRTAQGVGMNVQQDRMARDNRYASDSRTTRKVTHEVHRSSDVVKVEFQQDARRRGASEYSRTGAGTLPSGYPRAGGTVTGMTRGRLGERTLDNRGRAVDMRDTHYDHRERYGGGYQRDEDVGYARESRFPGTVGTVAGYNRGSVGFQSGHVGLQQHDLSSTHSHGVNQDMINEHTRNTKFAPLEQSPYEQTSLHNRDQYTRNTKLVKVDSLGRAADNMAIGDVSSYQVTAPYAVEEQTMSGPTVARPLCRPGDTQPSIRGGHPGRHQAVGRISRERLVTHRCPVCREYLREPKQLECHHTLCLSCLQRINKRPDTVTCPTCRETTMLANGEMMDGLPTPSGYFNQLQRRVVIEVTGVVSDMIVVDDVIAVGTNSKLAPIHLFDFEGNSLAQVGRDIIASSPKLAYNSKRNLIIANTKMKIATFDHYGALVAQLSNPSFQNSGGVVYVRDKDWYLIPDERTTKLLCFNPQAGRVVRTIGMRNDGPAPFSFPASVASDHTGLIAIGDRKNHLIKVIDMEGNYAQTFGYQGRQYGELMNPLGLCFDRDGRLLICDSGNKRVVRLTLSAVEGQEQWECILPTGSFGQAQPKSVSVSKDGVLVVTAYQKAINAPDTVHVYHGYT